MEKIVAKFGVPLKIITDQGKQFESTIFNKLQQGLDIENARTSASHQPSNGIVERHVKTLKERLKFLCHVDTSQWDQKMQHALRAIRFYKYFSTVFSPFELLTSHQQRTKSDAKFYIYQIESSRS
ncbi:Retrovirus-related Pol polyprotein [Thelohanellus kitauei]|uniref:Retrovirus-related Pol polyprotein n=1 Tax=Thelohanellus kitauei TaxID=669202 RepID=A0A0C2MQS2_THEKT|nr:Retrovirus-related Pol polyprotein [Thelohanellus kitauei]